MRLTVFSILVATFLALAGTVAIAGTAEDWQATANRQAACQQYGVDVNDVVAYKNAGSSFEWVMNSKLASAYGPHGEIYRYSAQRVELLKAIISSIFSQDTRNWRYSIMDIANECLKGNLLAGSAESATDQSTEIDKLPNIERELLIIERELNEMCRGWPGDDPHISSVCEIRDKVSIVLNGLDYCYGKRGQPRSEMQWHRCTSASLRWEE